MSKASLLLSLDNLAILDKLSNEQAGELIKALYQYSKDGTLPELSYEIDLVITPFINQINQSKIKNAHISEKRKISGALGGSKKHANAKNKTQEPIPVVEVIEPPNKIKTKPKKVDPQITQQESESESESEENLRMFHEIAAYIEQNNIDSWWGIDLFEDDMFPAIRAVMMYDFVFKNKKNVTWRDYIKLKLTDAVINGINLFVSVYRTKKELYDYCLGLHKDDFWKSKSLRDIFTFNKQSVAERYERAINNLNKLPASADI